MQYQELLFLEDRERQKRSRIFGTLEFRQAYARYIGSAQWKKLGTQIRKRAGGCCERCKFPNARLEIHHVTYDRFQCEQPSDLQALCPSCHVIADREREQRNRQKYEAACEEGRYLAARETYLSKKYGEDWYLRDDINFEDIYEEFENWIDEKEDSEKESLE